MPTGISAPPPRPCTTRAAIKKPKFGAAAQASDAAVNTANDTRSTRRAPNVLAIHPVAGCDTHTASRYDVTTHSTLRPPPWRRG